MRTSVYVAIVATVMLLQACSKNSSTDPNPNPTPLTMDDLVVADNFNYSTTQNVKVTVNAVDANGAKIPYTLFKIYAKNGADTLLLQKLFTDSNGYAETYVSFPSTMDSIMFKSFYIGIPSDIALPVTGNTVSLNYTQWNAASIAYNKAALKASTTSVSFKIGTTVYTSLSSFDNNGKPTNLISPRDVVPSGMLTNVNYTLPEGVSVPANNPSLLDATKQTNITIDALSDVWVTFVHEGAGYRNALGYFKYAINNPPKKVTDIDTVKIIFPNASYYNSGGSLYSGDKVYLGRFPAQTGIGWVCLSDGFRNGTITANNWNYKLYSFPDFNPQTNANLKKQSLLLLDNVNNKVLLTFEDIERDKGGDQDFNDVVYYITANPVEAINTGNLIPLQITPSTDTDKDGVPDIYDEYPNDATKAFNNWYPNSSTFGTIAFEDLWPAKGDYDMNDHVVNYRINQITNAANKVVEINGQLVLSAMGASYHNGFAMALGIPNSSVQSVTTTFKKSTGSLVKHGVTQIGGNGLEVPVNNPYNGVNQEAVYVVYDDGYDILAYKGGGNGVNTTIGSTYSTPDTISFKMLLATPQDYYNMGIPPYNPFIIVNQERGREVHLPNYVPTGKADTKYFMTAQDNTIISKKRYYKTYKNLPFGILLPTKFDYPKELTPVIDAYPNFAMWAQSSGSSYTDWYSNTTSGYRNTSNIYHK